MFSSRDKLFMDRAFELAMESLHDNEVPVGAVIVKDNKMYISATVKESSECYKQKIFKADLNLNKINFLRKKKIKKQKIKTETLDSFEAKNKNLFLKKIDYIKIDTEGHDYKVLLGAKKFIKVEFIRPKKYSTDKASSYDVARHALNWFENNNKSKKISIVVILSPTTPFRTVNDIDNVIKKLINNKKANSVIGITEVDYPPYWMLKKNKKSRLSWLIKEKKNFTE